MRRRFPMIAASAVLALGTLAACTPQRQQSFVPVLAAASLAEVLPALSAAYKTSTGIETRHTFAATSTLARQIEAGAEAAVFVSADEQWMDYLDARGLVVKETRQPIAGNRLVLVVPSDKPLKLDLAAPGWLDRLPQGRIATGDPAHVPAGRYAEQALRKLGAWQVAGPRLARADNVRAALVLVERGEAVAGIVYATDAAASKSVAVAGTFPAEAHDAIIYAAAVVKGPHEAAGRAFVAHLSGRKARAVFVQHGFEPR